MKIVVNLDVMLAKRKMRLKELAGIIGLTEQALSTIKTNKVKGVRFDTLVKICNGYRAIFFLYCNRVSQWLNASVSRGYKGNTVTDRI